jgi:hypothetical protein
VTIREVESRRQILLASCAVGVVALAAIAALLFVALRPRTLEGHRVQASAASPRPASPIAEGARPAGSKGMRLFGPKSFWNRRLGDEPIDPSSAALVQELAQEVQRETQSRIGPWIATNISSTPLYRVGRHQRSVRVRLDAQGTPGEAALQKAFAAVPIPGRARPAAGQDRHMTIWQPSTDRLWEFWQAHRASDGWHASWGGAIRGVSRSPGYYTASAWPGARRNWGATASSLPVIGGTITVDDMQRGSIRHALAVALPAPRARTFAWPAQRTDGTGGTTALPEGARLQLDPQLNLDSLRLPPLVRMIAEAAQRYGIVVRDQTHKGISLFGEDARGARADMLHQAFASQTPLELLSRFPWDRLRVLRMRLCTKAPCVAG